MRSSPEPLFTTGFFALVGVLGAASLWANHALADWMPFAVHAVGGVM